MDFADCLSAFEDFLRTKETFRCSSEEMDSFLQTLSITEETRDLVKKAIMENPPPTLKVHKQTVSLSSCYIDSIKQMQDVLQKDRTGKLGHIMQEIQKSLGLPQRNMFWEITTILEFSGEDRVSVRICEQKQRVCEAKVKMHQYFLLEGLQDVVACLSEIGNSSLEDVWKSCKSSSAPLAMQKVGMNQSKFEKTLESFPEAFQVEDGKVFLKDNPQITYSLILCHMQSAQHKLKDHLYNKGALLKNELFHLTPQLLSRAEILAMGEGMETFSFALQSLRDDFLLIPPHMLVVAQGTSQVQDNPFVSAVSKIKDFIRGENAGNGTLMSQLLRVVNKTLGPCEQAAVGNTSQKLRETIAAYPGHFIIGHGTVFVVSDDAVLLDVMNIKMQNLPITKIDQEISSSECSSDQYTESFEDSANSYPLDQETGSSQTDNDVCSSVQYTEQSECSANSDPPNRDEGSHCTDNDVCSSIQNTEHPEGSTNSGYLDHDTGSLHTENEAQSSIQNTELPEELANSDTPYRDTGSSHTDNDVCSTVQNTKCLEDSVHSDTSDQDTRSLCTDDDVCSSVQNTEHDEDLSNSVTPDQDTGSTCIDDDDVCSSIQNTGDPEDLANSDPLDQGTGSSHTDNDVCSSVQNTEHSEDFTNSDPSIQGTASPDGVCSSVQKTEHDEDLSSSVTPDQDTGSTCNDDDGRCSSVQNTEHGEDFAISDPSHHNTASPHADDNACTGSSIQNSEHDEDLANYDTADQDTRSPCIDDDVCSSLQNTEHDEDFANSDPSHQDTASPNAFSSVHNIEHPEVLANYDTPGHDTDSLCTADDTCTSVQKSEHSEDFPNSDPSHHDTVSADADVCSSIQDTEHDEDFPNSDTPADTTSPDTDNDIHACSSDQTPSLGQDEVESLGSEIISDSESLHSGTSSEAGNLDPDTVLSESTDQEIVTILQDLNYFGKLIKEFLSKATYPILSVSLSDGWLIASLWDGPTFATCLSPSSCDQQQILGPSERIALDFLTSKSILKVVFDWKHCFEISDALGIQMVKVFDLMAAERLIRPGSRYSQTLPESLSYFGIDPCCTIEVCIGTIQAPVYGEVYSKEAILNLKETARWTLKQVPYLYQKMLGLMKPYQITKVSKLYDDEVEDQPFPSSQNEEPSCSAITSSITSSVTSSASPNASTNSAPVVSSSEMGSQVNVPVTSSTKVKVTSEMPVSVHRVSSTSGDLDEPNSKGLAQSSDDIFYMEENLQSDLLSGPEVDSNFLIRDDRSRTTSGSSRSRTTSPSSRSRTTSRRSKKMQTTKKQEESSRQVTEGSGSTPSLMAYEDGTSEQLSCMVNAKVLHYDDAGKPILITCANELANEAINPCQISHELSKEFGEIVMRDQEKFLEAFGICIKYNLKKLSETDKSLALDQLTEVVMDLGRKPSARYYQPGHPGQLKIKTIGENKLTKQDLKDILEGHCSPVSSDHRSTIKGTLHRVGIMCNRQNEPIGLTTLTKHAVLGCATPLFDLMNQGQSILFVGSPGVGKSTILREAARVINDVVMRRVVIVDTCNEIAGDGDVPHPAVGGARRVQLPDRDSQPNMIREVVRNHSPHTLVIDEVVTEADAAAVHATRERGIQVISAAPGQTLQDVILNPKLRHLFGGIQNMAMSHPGQGITGHTVMQRTQPAAFDILVEMYDRYRWIVHTDFTRSIDLCLQKVQVGVQERRVFLKEVSKDSQGIPQVLVRDLFVMYPL